MLQQSTSMSDDTLRSYSLHKNIPPTLSHLLVLLDPHLMSCKVSTNMGYNNMAMGAWDMAIYDINQ